MKPLTEGLVQNFLHQPSISDYLDTANKQWYLRLTVNNSFYFESSSTSFFSIEGPLINFQQLQVQQQEKKMDYSISVDNILQALLTEGIVEKDVGSFILADIKCGEASFLVGKVLRIKDSQMLVSIYYGEYEGVKTQYNVIPEKRKWIPKTSIFRKKMELSKKRTLKKDFQTILKLKYKKNLKN